MLWRNSLLAFASLLAVIHAQRTSTAPAVVVTSFVTQQAASSSASSAGASRLSSSPIATSSLSAISSPATSIPSSLSPSTSIAAGASSSASSAVNGSGGGLSSGAIAGIVVGVVVAFILAATGGYLLARRRKEQERGSATIPHPTGRDQHVQAQPKPGPGNAPYAAGSQTGQAYASVYAPHAAAGQPTGNQMSELSGESSAHRATQAAYQQQFAQSQRPQWTPGHEVEAGRSELPGQ